MTTLLRGSDSDDPGSDRLAIAHRAFAEQYEQLLERALDIARRHVADEDEVEEVVEDAFLDLWENCYADGDLPREPVAALLFKILNCRIVDHYRHEKSLKDVQRDPRFVDAAVARETNRTDTGRVAEGEMLRWLVRYLVAALPKKEQRGMYGLVEFVGLSWEEAAEHLRLKPNTAKFHLSKARRLVREGLMRRGYTPPSAGSAGGGAS